MRPAVATSSAHTYDGLLSCVASSAGRLMGPRGLVLRGGLVALAALVTNAAIAGPAVAAGGWNASSYVSPAGQQTLFGTHPVVDRAGDEFEVWPVLDGTSCRLMLAERAAGSASFEPPEFVTPAGESASYDSYDLASDGHGDLTLVWVDQGAAPCGPTEPNQTGQVEVSSRAAGSAKFDTPHAISPAGRFEDDTTVALDRVGRATVIWDQSANGDFSGGAIQEATRSAGSRVFAAPRAISPVGATDPSLAVADNGDATAIWSAGDQSGAPTRGLQATIRGAGKTSFAAVQQLVPATAVVFAPISTASSADGKTVAVWSQSNPRSINSAVVQAATRSAGHAAFSAARTISPRGTLGAEPDVAMNARGSATAAWVRLPSIPNYSGFGVQIQAADMPTGSNTFDPAYNLSSASKLVELPSVALNTTGETVLAWDGQNKLAPGQTPTVYGTIRTAGRATFGPTATISAPGQEAWAPLAEIDPAGTTTLIWAAIDTADPVQTQRVATAEHPAR